MENPILKLIADNPALLDAVKAVFMKHASLTDENLIHLNATNELIGERVRGVIYARSLIEDAFKEIAEHKSEPESKTQVNGSR